MYKNRLLFLRHLAIFTSLLFSISYGYAVLTKNLNIASTIVLEPAAVKNYEITASRTAPYEQPTGSNIWHYTYILSLKNLSNEMARSWEMAIKVPKALTITSADTGSFYNCLHKLSTLSNDPTYNVLKIYGISNQNAFIDVGETISNMGIGFSLPYNTYNLDLNTINVNFYNEIDKVNPNFTSIPFSCTLVPGSSWNSGGTTYKQYTLNLTNNSSYESYEWKAIISPATGVDPNQITFTLDNQAYKTIENGKIILYSGKSTGKISSGGNFSFSFQISYTQTNVSFSTTVCTGKALILN